MEANQKAGHEDKFKFGIDLASSGFFKDDKYDLGFKWNEAHPMSKPDIADLYRELVNKYPIALLEDPFARDD
jgi:enolase